MARKTTEQRFWEKVNIRGPDDCWEWTGCRMHAGHGGFFYRGNTTLASKVAWILTNGDIPDGVVVRHKCDNPPCCNPAHLLLGTHYDNIHDSLDRSVLGLRTALNEELVLAMVSDYATGQFNVRDLARKYSTSRETVSDIMSGKRWRHVTE